MALARIHCNFGRHRPPTRPPVADRGHAAPVDMERPANGTRWGNRGSNPRAPPGAVPVDDVLPHAARGGYVHLVRDLSKPRSPQGTQRTVSRVTRRLIVPLTCRNAGGADGCRRPDSSIGAVGAASSQLVDNSVDQGSPSGSM
jgi:hypothetical protein